jgi:hypothetical protein
MLPARRRRCRRAVDVQGLQLRPGWARSRRAAAGSVAVRQDHGLFSLIGSPVYKSPLFHERPGRGPACSRECAASASGLCTAYEAGLMSFSDIARFGAALGNVIYGIEPINRPRMPAGNTSVTASRSKSSKRPRVCLGSRAASHRAPAPLRRCLRLERCSGAPHPDRATSAGFEPAQVRPRARGHKSIDTRHSLTAPVGLR